MNASAKLQRMRTRIAGWPPTAFERWRRKVLDRDAVLTRFEAAIRAAGPLPPSLDREVWAVLAAYAEVLLADGWVPEDGSHPLARFAAWLGYPGAALPHPFPVPLLEALCHPDAVAVHQDGCKRCRVVLPVRVVPGRHPVYGPFEPVIAPCPLCGSADLGWFHRTGTGLRVLDTRNRAGGR